MMKMKMKMKMRIIVLLLTAQGIMVRGMMDRVVVVRGLGFVLPKSEPLFIFEILEIRRCFVELIMFNV